MNKSSVNKFLNDFLRLVGITTLVTLAMVVLKSIALNDVHFDIIDSITTGLLSFMLFLNLKSSNRKIE